MRHFLPACPVAALAFGMGKTALERVLITSPGRPLRFTPGALRTPRTTVDIAPVAAAADRHLAAATGTIEQTGSDLHRQLLPMSTGLKPLIARYFLSGRAMHGLGVRYRKDCGGRDRCRTCLNGTIGLPDYLPFVTLRRADFTQHPESSPSPHVTRCSPPSMAMFRVIHQLSAGSYRHLQSCYATIRLKLR